MSTTTALRFFGSLFDMQLTIMLGSQLPTITDALTITGPGADLLTIDAGNGDDGSMGNGDGFQIFVINDGEDRIDDGNGNVSGVIDVELRGMKLTGGDGGGDNSGNGGAIRNEENLKLIDSTLSGNSAHLSGGGIYNTGYIEVINTTLSGNKAPTEGGGIHNSGFAKNHQQLVFRKRSAERWSNPQQCRHNRNQR